MKIVFSSGFNRQHDLEDLVEKGIVGFIQKPYRLKELAETVATALKNG